MNYKDKEKSLLSQNFSNSLNYLQSSLDENNQPTFDFECLIKQVISLYDSNFDAFYIPDYNFLIEFLDNTLYSFDNFSIFSTDDYFFQFFIYIISKYQTGDIEKDKTIKEKAIICSSYLVSLEFFEYNELSEEVLKCTLQYLPENSIALIPSLTALKYKQYNDFFLSSGILDDVIQIIDQNEYNADHFYFLSKYSKYLKEYVTDEIISKFQRIAIEHSNFPYGFHFLSILVKYFELKSNEVNIIIQDHLIFESDENASNLMRILHCYSMNNIDFFTTSNFFDNLMEFFNSCELRIQIKILDVVYMIVPQCANELLSFVCHLVEISDSCSFSMISKIYEILLIFLQEFEDNDDENIIVSHFLNLSTFEIFERIMSSDKFNDYITVIEILLILKRIDKASFFDVLYQSSIIEILEELVETDDSYRQSLFEKKISILCQEEEDFNDYDYD